MLYKSLFMGITMTSLCACAVAVTNDSQDTIIDGNEVTVYENFKIQDRTTSTSVGANTNGIDEVINSDKSLKSLVANKTNSRNSDVIAYLGTDLQAVKSDERNEGHGVALVVAKDKNLRSYIIDSVIRFECKKNVSDCIPEGINAEQVAKLNLYKVTVSNFAEWQSTMNILKNSSSVKKVYPSYNYGIKNEVK